MIESPTRGTRTTPIVPVMRELPLAVSPLDTALERAVDCLLNLQNDAGYWCGELQGDSILESEYLLMKFILAQDADPELPLIANYLRRLQLDTGGWAPYPRGKAGPAGAGPTHLAPQPIRASPHAPPQTPNTAVTPF